MVLYDISPSAMPDSMVVMAQKIESTRVSRGMTLDELGLLSKVKKDLIFRMEKADASVAVSQYAKVFAALGLETPFMAKKSRVIHVETGVEKVKKPAENEQPWPWPFPSWNGKPVVDPNKNNSNLEKIKKRIIINA